MMDYMYSGELQIFQEDLDRFLNVAQRLKLEGLINDPDAYQKEEVNVKETQPSQKKEDRTFLRKKTETINLGQERVISKVNMTVYPENILEVDEQIELNIVKNLDGIFSCKFCGKKSGRNIGQYMHELYLGFGLVKY